MTVNQKRKTKIETDTDQWIIESDTDQWIIESDTDQLKPVTCIHIYPYILSEPSQAQVDRKRKPSGSALASTPPL